MMIPDYDNDAKMAELGRSTTRWKAIKKAREGIRDHAVMIGSCDDVEAIEKLHIQLNAHINNLSDALATGSAVVSEPSE